jgi:UDP-N-acetylglucosamine--N-acetylmuramyl-(pentapeptide) pyrophosphoryl-undecaprenol N-acetylglucosamine transferase
MAKNKTPKKTATILLTGGGTGGHITPILALAHELKKLDSGIKTVYVGERNSKYQGLTKDHAAIDKQFAIYSGKYRRYYGESIIKKIIDIKSLALNFRDIFYVLIGLYQANKLLNLVKPDIVFLKGGYVGVPIGIMAARKGLTIVTHDSDAVPGLANRIVTKYVSLHATALPADTYDYPADITKQVGVLVEHTYIPVGSFLKKKYKQRLKVPTDAKLVVVTGGSSGATAINKAVEKIAHMLLEADPKLHIIHQAGKGKLSQLRHSGSPRWNMLEFLTPMFVYLGAADIVVTRASGNTLAELGVQGKACIVIPSPVLADGHQLRNAEYLVANKAAVVLQEKGLAKKLQQAITELSENPMLRIELSKKLQALTPTGAAKDLAKLIIKKLD